MTAVMPLTVMLTGAEVVVAPSLSVATAVITCAPTVAFAQVAPKDGPVEIPIEAPSTKNSTRATVPSESPAFAAIATDVGASKLALFAGDVIDTVGGTFAATVIVRVAESENAPSLSYARAT